MHLLLERWAEIVLNCFSDINECASGTHNCSDHAVCNNTKGGHNCTCKKGFIGDGVNCTGNTFAFALIIKKRSELKWDVSNSIQNGAMLWRVF